TASSKKAIIGVLTEGDTDIPVAGVKVTITPAASGSGARTASGIAPASIKKKSTAKGSFHQTNLLPGSYTVKLEKLGFVSKTVEINVVEGETVKLEEVLERT
ncbi:MAG: carboxypeptidase-like regulatory domain-containing protein, partial [Cytophagales bacterium]|nr:carboxypeptidase-like regulatory domain-containing protein [Cytophagales bacterium]